MNVGLIGCGNISGIYLKNAARLRGIDIVACADMVTEKARSRADEFEIPRVLSVDELLRDGIFRGATLNCEAREDCGPGHDIYRDAALAGHSCERREQPSYPVMAARAGGLDPAKSIGQRQPLKIQVAPEGEGNGRDEHEQEHTIQDQVDYT